MGTNRFFSIVSSIVLTMAVNASASVPRVWQKVDVPGGVCGNGQQYSMFLSKGNSEKIALYFMGGGACWDKSSCHGIIPLTKLKPIPQPKKDTGFLSTDPNVSPVADHTVLYFPYCTGDVHVGSHEASYKKNVTVHHKGEYNVTAGLQHAHDQNLVNMMTASKVVVYGYSAGAIGAIGHMDVIDSFTNPGAQKFVIPDSPGLHFGSDFWGKFPQPYADDVTAAIEGMGAVFQPNEGNTAYIIPELCKTYSHWNFNILQGSRDFIMSTVFGEISQKGHERLVYGPKGIYRLTKDPNDNCSAWVPKSSTHVFFTKPKDMEEEAAGKSARDYIFEALTSGQAGPTYAK